MSGWVEAFLKIIGLAPEIPKPQPDEENDAVTAEIREKIEVAVQRQDRAIEELKSAGADARDAVLAALHHIESKRAHRGHRNS